MLEFWGFEMLGGGGSSGSGSVEIIRSPSFPAASKNWAVNMRSDHNHLRMTRVIRSLRILGCGEEARALFEALRECAREGLVGGGSLMFWERAVGRRLSVPPQVGEGKEAGFEGEAWLDRWD